MAGVVSMEPEEDHEAAFLFGWCDFHVNDEVILVAQAALAFLGIVRQHIESATGFEIIHKIVDHHPEWVETESSQILASFFVDEMAIGIFERLQHASLLQG